MFVIRIPAQVLNGGKVFRQLIIPQIADLPSVRPADTEFRGVLCQSRRPFTIVGPNLIAGGIALQPQGRHLLHQRDILFPQALRRDDDGPFSGVGLGRLPVRAVAEIDVRPICHQIGKPLLVIRPLLPHPPVKVVVFINHIRHHGHVFAVVLDSAQLAGNTQPHFLQKGPHGLQVFRA